MLSRIFALLLLLSGSAFGAGFSSSLAFRGQASTETLLNSLVAAWSFDEPFTTSGNRTNSAGATQTLTDKFNNTPAIATGWFQGGVDQSSGSQTRVLTNLLGATLGTGSFTFAMWYIQANGSGYVSESGYGVNQDDGTKSDFSLDGQGNWNVWGATGTRVATVVGVGNFPVNFPTLAIFGWDSVNQQAFAYVNGGSKLTSNMTPAGSRQNTTNEFRIWWESGAIDELYCWNRVLTDAEATRLWGGGTGLKYPFTTGFDFAGNATSNFQWAVNYNGGGQIFNTTSNAAYTLINTLQTAGIWTNIYFALPFISENLIACKTPLKWKVAADGNGNIDAMGNPQRKSTIGNETDFVNADLTVSGLQGSGNAGNDTKFLISVFPGNVQNAFTPTDNAQAVYVSAIGGGGAKYDMGGVGSVGFYIGANFNGTQTKVLNGDGVNNTITASSPGAGFYLNSRVSSTDHKVYFANGNTAWAQLGSTDSTSYSSAFQSISTTWCTENDGNVGPAVQASADTLSWGSLHIKGLSSGDGQTLFNAVTLFREQTGGGYAPAVVFGPTNAAVISGNNRTLVITTTLSSPTYQWQKNGSAIGGATQSSYTVTGAGASDFATYNCVVTSGGIGFAGPPAQLAVVTTTTVSNWVNQVNIAQPTGTLSSNTIWAIDQFWNGMVTDSLNTKMYSVNCFVPDSLVACSVALLQPSGRAPLWVNNNFSTADLSVNGIASDGSSKYFDTLVSDSVDIASVSDLSYTEYFYNVVNGAGLQGIITGDDNDGLMLVPSRSGNTQWYDYGPANGGAGNLHAAFPGNGYYCGTRTASNADALYFASSGSAHAALATGSSATTYAAVGLNVYVSKLNGLALAIQVTSSYASIGKGLTSTDSSNQYNRVQTLRTALGGGFR